MQFLLNFFSYYVNYSIRTRGAKSIQANILTLHIHFLLIIVNIELFNLSSTYYHFFLQLFNKNKRVKSIQANILLFYMYTLI